MCAAGKYIIRHKPYIISLAIYHLVISQQKSYILATGKNIAICILRIQIFIYFSTLVLIYINVTVIVFSYSSDIIKTKE